VRRGQHFEEIFITLGGLHCGGSFKINWGWGRMGGKQSNVDFAVEPNKTKETLIGTT
jgi:hypothetical protein